MHNEIFEANSHRSDVPRNENPAAIGATCRTVGSGVPSGLTPVALRKSIAGSLRRKPLPISGSSSASA